ncbi:Hsp20/alpha crystallin family protein [Candidatus Desulforudis audaxviator]|uniref:Uncharacterized protein n=1 Tax=Desulforudis audaxviator (strain MP104C) TaxID=477974 RepID=B1I4U5_DESAP|nr:Hsp20/alpha crystallin family protein [Candidatus Desulforudis audaxviator]ACA60000.1 conserved hypothetical protein [Candidatus Desulforudis audaxviator MP104C]AZK60016.1 Molecular chaperone IbpA, HSP20 family [Candidatus Desulforudis audaxviator]
MTKKKDISDEVKADMGINELLNGLGNFIDLIKQMEAQGKAKISYTGEIKGLDKAKGLKGLFGIDIGIGDGGSADVKPFGNISKKEKDLVIEGITEPLVDIFEERNNVLVVAELPGVNEDNFHFQVSGDILIIEAAGRDRQYRKEMLLPTMVDPEGATTVIKNGIVEIRLPITNNKIKNTSADGE